MLKPDFNNENIAELNNTTLPQVENLNLQVLAQQYAPLNLMINGVLSLLFLMLGALVYVQNWIVLPSVLHNFIPYALCIFAVTSLLIISLNFLADKQKRYALRQLDLHFSSGLMFKKLVSQPISRIQHVELKQGPLERFKNLATLQVYSAGGSHYTFEIPGLDLATAQQIHQFILKNKDLIHNA